MSNFKLVKFEDLVHRVKVGFVGSINDFYCDKENGIPLIRTTDLNDHGIDYSNLKYVTKAFHLKNKKSQVKKGDIIIARHGDNGKANVFKENFEAQVLNAVIIEPNQKLLTSNLIKIFFDSPFIKKQILGDVKGSVQGVINTAHIANILFPINDSINYEEVSSLISSLDSKIELNNSINAELEAMAKTLYDYWFVQFDFPNAKGKPYKSSGGKMIWNEELKREIPEEWVVKNLFVAMDVQYGFPFDTTKFTDDETQKPVIRIRDILENTISTYSTEEVNDKYKLFSKDLLIGMDGNFHLNFWDKDGAYLNQRSVRIRSRKNSETSNFQAYFQLTPYMRAREKNISRTTVGHLSDKDLKSLFLLQPIRTEHFKPKETFDSFLSKIISNRLENQKLSELRDWLLPMLMNGQVKVKDAEDMLAMAAEQKEEYLTKKK